MARLFTCADVLEQLEDSNGDVSSGAYEGELIIELIVGYLPKATSDADELSGTDDMHDTDLDASYGPGRPGEGSLWDSS